MNNFPINQIMQRYTVNGNTDLLYSYEQLSRLNIDQDFIYTLLETFENTNSFSKDKYDKFPLETIIDYIQRTHTYYLSKKLLEIEQSIHILLRDYSDRHPLLPILQKFYIDYTTDLTAHIHHEEKELLPYISKLMEVEQSETNAIKYYNVIKNYSLQSFIDTHHDTEKDLSEVRSVIKEYQPRKTNLTPFRILLSQLETFEKDLCVHALIEDNVLVPKALKLENKVKSMIRALLS